MLLYDRITAHEASTVTMRGPRSMVQLSQDLCNTLLVPDPAGRPDLAGLKTHPFFGELSWHALRDGTAQSPLLAAAAEQLGRLVPDDNIMLDNEEAGLEDKPCPDEVLAQKGGERFDDL